MGKTARRLWIRGPLAIFLCVGMSSFGMIPASLETSFGLGAQDAPTPAWLAEINTYRNAAGLASVSDQPLWDQGLQDHLSYLANTTSSYFTGAYTSLHTENPASPFYTPDGAQEAGSSDLLEGSAGGTDVQAIDTWLAAPFHAIGILRPGLGEVAFAIDPVTGDAALDVLSGLATGSGPTAPVLFPGPGMVTGLTQYSGGEVPDPLQTCGWSGTLAGLPVVALLPNDPDPALSAQLLAPDGTVESSALGTLCIVDDHTYVSSDPAYGAMGAQLLSGDHAVFVVPRNPLAAGEYQVAVSQPGQADIDWSFTVEPSNVAIIPSQDPPPPTPSPSNSTPPTPSPPTPQIPYPPGPLRVPLPVGGMAATPDGGGYWLVDSQGAVSPKGDARYFGSLAGTPLDAPISHIVSTPDGGGYWLVASDGGTFAFGDAGFFGSMGGQRLNAPVVDITPTRDGRGYWLVAADGGVFAFGDARFLGSMGGIKLNKPVVGMAADYATGGYWEVATDGGVFAFGAPFYGSTGNLRLAKPVNGFSPTHDDGGYRFVAADGGMFDYGDAAFYGSAVGVASAPVVGMATDPITGGYCEIAQDGGVYSYDAPFYGAD